MPVKPISPKEVTALKATRLPDQVLEAFNELIAENWNGKFASFKQDTVVRLILHKFGSDDEGVPKVTGEDLFNRHWLDVEPVYREQGWKVEYDRPGFNESYPATFKFSK